MTDEAPIDDDLHRQGETLRQLAAQFPPESPEYQAIREAAQALVFVRSRARLFEAYIAYRANMDEPLSDAQRTLLESMGINPDSDDSGGDDLHPN